MPVPTQRPRGHRICDNCGAVENPAVKRFRLCGGCMITQYCSPECQRNNWNAHRAVCQHTSAQTRTADPNLARNLRKFCSMNSALIGWTAFQALDLRRMPSNIRGQALLIDLLPQPNAIDPARRFTTSEVYLVTRDAVLSQDPIVTQDILRREERCRRTGGLGALVVLVQCGDVSQVMPIEVDHPSKIAWDKRSDWESIFRNTIDGRIAFTPTAGPGVAYYS